MLESCLLIIVASSLGVDSFYSNDKKHDLIPLPFLSCINHRKGKSIIS